jgi:hypothetical protein
MPTEDLILEQHAEPIARSGQPAVGGLGVPSDCLALVRTHAIAVF